MAKHQEKRKVGRPTDYRPEYCEMLIHHMGEGFSFESFAANVHVNRDTLYNWCELFEDFSDAKKQGLQLSLKWWETVFRGQALGKIKGNPACAIFAMKNLHHWRDQKNIEITGKDGGPINYSNMTEDQLKEELAKLKEEEEQLNATGPHRKTQG